jgi:hypothetical protein
MMINERASHRTKELYEVIGEVQKAKTRKAKIELLQQYKSAPIIDYCRCLFDDRVQFNLPEGKPPYTPGKEESHPSSWHKENKKLAYIVKGLQGDQMPGLKRENVFIGILESVHPNDADLLVKMISKKAPKGITKKLIQEAFPSIIPS